MTAEQRLKRAAAKHAAAREELEATVRAARDAGLSLRKVAEVSGFSVEWVRKVAAG